MPTQQVQQRLLFLPSVGRFQFVERGQVEYLSFLQKVFRIVGHVGLQKTESLFEAAQVQVAHAHVVDHNWVVRRHFFGLGKQLQSLNVVIAGNGQTRLVHEAVDVVLASESSCIFKEIHGGDQIAKLKEHTALDGTDFGLVLFGLFQVMNLIQDSRGQFVIFLLDPAIGQGVQNANFSLLPQF